MSPQRDNFDDEYARIVDDQGLAQFVPNLVLVVGIGRSGTTALKHALGSHGQLLDTPHEAPLQRAIASAYGRHLVGTPQFKDYVRQTSVADWSNVDNSFRRLIFETSVGEDVGRHRLQAEYEAGVELDQLRGWIAKIGGLGRPAAAGFAGLFSGLKTVYIHRNGIDTVQSRTRFEGFAPATFRAHCEKWALSLRFLKMLERETEVFVVRHDELVARPAHLFERLLPELGLVHSDAPAQFALNTAAHPTQELRQGESIAEHYDNRPAGHSTWNDQQRRIFIELCGTAMTELGYDIPFA